MIEVRGLCKSFDGFRALDGLDLHAPKGAVYGLVGPNGAGKSTLIRHLTGIYRQDSGSVLVEGEPVYENPAVKRKIAYIPDEVFYYTQATLRDMKGLYRDLYPAFDEDCYRKLAGAFDLDQGRPIRKFSKGQQKQAAFWLALSLRPELVVLDEPVDGLDPVMRQPAGAGGRVRPRGHSEQGQNAAGAEPQRAAGESGEDPAGSAGGKGASRGFGDFAREPHRAAAAADPAGQKRGAERKAPGRGTSFSGPAAPEPGGDLYL